MYRRSFLTAIGLGSGALFSLAAAAEAAGSDRKSWQPDGLGYRARIGLLTPNDDAVPESEFWTMAPEGVSVHVARVLLVDTRTFANPPNPDDATALLAALSMQAIVLAFTTTSYVLGPDGEQALKARLEQRSNGIPVLLTGAAAVAAFRALGVRRIALIHPPWFADNEQQLGIAYFRNQGFDVVYANQMRLRGLEVAKSTDPATQVYRAISCGALCIRAHGGADDGRSRFLRREWIPRNWHDCGARGRTRSASAHGQPGGFLVCVAPSRRACTSKWIRPSVQHTEFRRQMKPRL
jgi:maleate cis-trans isomerase